jgi:glycogen phosphorylase
MANDRRIAYLSMEIGLDPSVPTYSGGLGVLAGDTIRSAADLKVPMVAVTLVHRKGYFYQRLDPSGWQVEEGVEWSIDDFLTEEPARASVVIGGRPVQLRCWRMNVTGVSGFVVPVYFLDSDLPENSEQDRTLTHWLYGGDSEYRLCQEVILGIGGVRMLRALGYKDIERFHMNEGHASLCTLELLEERRAAGNREGVGDEDLDAVRRMCVFTTHTPVPAGHDKFPMAMVDKVLDGYAPLSMRKTLCCDGVLNMTYLALNLSHYVNGVAKRHGEVSRHMFSAYTIDSITNGVHAATWVSGPFQALFDKYIPGWREDNFSLRYALSVPRQEVWEAHTGAKRELIEQVNRSTNTGMDMDVLTLGFARRAAPYKRADLLLSNPDRLRAIARNAGPLQIVYAGKSHPRDEEGKKIIQRIWQARTGLRDAIRIAYLPNYDMELGRLITSGVDVWLNTPQPPMEASGTSGMKAALNGVPSLSVLDGWWIEGCIEGTTGWAVGQDGRTPEVAADSAADAASLYDKLENVVVPAFYKDRDRFLNIMVHAIALNGSFFNTQRMIQQYVLKAYFE